MATKTTTRKSTAKATSKTTVRKAERVDVYQQVTDRIIELLESGVVPWHQPWNTGTVAGYPRSMSTGKVYRGMNVFLLQMTAMSKGYASAWWGTYKQITERGGQVRKGEKGTPIVFWSFSEKEVRNESTGKMEVKKAVWARTYTVFNAEQADAPEGLKGIPAPQPIVVTEDNEPIEECEAILDAYYATGPDLRHGGAQAYYNRDADRVQMPHRSDFESSAAYYGALFHETTHSTGHADRLNRKGITELGSGHVFGSPSYAIEELVAEMGSSFLSGLTGVSAQVIESSAAYLDNWLSALKNDKKLLIQAASQAQKAVDHILGAGAQTAADDTEEDAA